MSVKVPNEGWVVVCDGAKALFLHNEGDSVYPNLKTEQVMNRPAPPARELGSDRPGRTHESHGHGRSAMEQPDLHEAAEAEFLGDVAAQLGRLQAEGSLASLILVAPPRALGTLRKALPAAVQSVVSAELAKDLVSLPLSEIEAHLSA